MTPTEIETACRNRYNAVGDSFWSQAEILWLIYEAIQDLLSENNKLIEATLTTSTVASQREYDYPPNTIQIKRIEYEGQKLEPIDFREDDFVTGFVSQDVNANGTPWYYSTWNDTIYLRPTPSAVGTLTIYSYNEHPEVEATSTIEIPDLFHISLVDYVVGEMCAKDLNYTGAARFQARWEMTKRKVKKYIANKKRGDSFANVKDMDAYE